jgi:hypothetical protein
MTGRQYKNTPVISSSNVSAVTLNITSTGTPVSDLSSSYQFVNEPGKQVGGVMNTYIIVQSDYMYDEPVMEEFKGTWRELLYKLNNVTKDNINDPFNVDWDENEVTIASFSNDQLKACFELGNGDGAPYVMVWDVENGEQVIK